MGEKRGLRNFLVFSVLLLFFLILFTPQTKSWGPKSGNQINCSGCADCNAALGNASGGDIITLNTTITGQSNWDYEALTGVCIYFYMIGSNMTFDCQSNSIIGNGSGAGISSLMIRNITIRNCNISNFYRGISLSYTQNSTIMNSTVNLNKEYGIGITSSKNVTISNNSINFNLLRGVSSSSPYTTVVGNSFNSNGNGSIQEAAIFISSSDNSTISNNTIINNTYGIYLYYSSNCTLKSNNLTNNQRSFFVEGGGSNLIHNIDGNNNTINNKPIYYWISHSNETINLSSNPGYIAVINSQNITIQDLNMSYNGQGIFLDNTSNSRIINVTANYNYIGIQINSQAYSASRILTTNNTITNNSVNYNDLSGIAVYYSDNTSLINNSLSYNGFSIQSTISPAINLWLNNKIIMKNNTMNNNKYNLFLFRNLNLFQMDIDTGNKINGKSVYYLINQANTEINSSHNPGFLAIVNSTNMTVRNLNITNNGENFLFDGLNNSRIYNITSSISVNSFIINNTHNSVFSSITAIDSLQDALDFTSSTNNTIINLNFSQQGIDGITFVDCDKNFIYNSTFKHGPRGSTGRGLYLQHTNNTLIDGVYTYNISYGITISNGYNNIITNSIFENNTDGNMNGKGIEINSANNNTFMNVMVNGSMACDFCGGVMLYNSNNNTFINLTSINNAYGIFFVGTSKYNVINNSKIENNTIYGLYFYEWSGSPQYNLIYNNYIRNNINYYNYSASLINYFNTTKTLLTSGTNVIGGSYLGGNFWATLNNTGFSQLCNDSDSDGICDTEYNIDGLNYDYLPLYSLALVCIPTWRCTDWSTCSGGIQIRTCTDVYSCGVDTNKPAESQFCTSGGGSLPPAPTTTTETITTASPGSPAVVSINNPSMGLTKLTVNVSQTVSNLSITITKLNSTQGADLRISLGRNGALYEAYEISTTLSNSNISNVEINFKVNKTWLANQNKTVTSVRLYRYVNNAWTRITTTLTGQDSQYYYFSAVSPGFSTFVVFFGEFECDPGEKRCFENQVQLCLGNATWLVTEKCLGDCKDGECLETPFKFDLKTLYFVGGIVIAGLIVVFLLRRIPIGKNKSSKEVRSNLHHKQFVHRFKQLK